MNLRCEDGRWSIEGLTDDERELKRHWVEALPRYLDIIDPLFLRAQEAGEFDFINSLIPIRGLRDAGWDAWKSSKDALMAMTPLINETKDWTTRRHLKLWAWGHTVEASEPYELLRNLIEVAGGGRFHIEWFPDVPVKGGRKRPQHPMDKINQIASAGKNAGLDRIADPLNEIWETDLRNAVFHADYALHGADVRLPKVARNLEHETIEALAARAAAYIEAIVILHDHYIGEYTEPKLISAGGFAPGEKAWVMVREGQGAAGLRHALTAHDIAHGGIQWCLGLFTPDENAMLNADPMLVKLPRRLAPD